MAGRGTDIKIDERVRQLTGEVEIAYQKYRLGGLFVLGTEKHETRRIDNQLRGRSGRQGDPGLSQFMVSPQDDIMRVFGGDRLYAMFNSPMFAAVPDSEPLLESKMLTKRIDSVQRQVEGRNFDIRKHILEYDDVLNNHRMVIYSRRNKILEKDTVHENVLAMVREEAESLVETTIEGGNRYEWDLEALAAKANSFMEINDASSPIAANAGMFAAADTREELVDKVEQKYLEKLSEVQNLGSPDDFAQFERGLWLQSIDELWMNHIDRMSHLREEVAFEGFAQKQPLVVYKERAYDRFIGLMGEIRFKVVKGLLSASVASDQTVEQVTFNEEDLVMSLQNALGEGANEISEDDLRSLANLLSDQGITDLAQAVAHQPSAGTSQSASASGSEDGVRVIRADSGTSKATDAFDTKNVGRNDPCPCGSGKKFKHCHGK